MSSNVTCISQLKNHSWFSNALNMLLLSNFAAKYAGVWGKKRNISNHRGNIQKVGKNVFNRFLTNVLNTRRTASYRRELPASQPASQLVSPTILQLLLPQTNMNSCPLLNEDLLTDELNTIIYNTDSPLVKGKRDSERGIESIEATRYTNPSEWFPSGAPIPTPTLKGVRSFIDITSVIILNAFISEYDIVQRQELNSMRDIPPDLQGRLLARLENFRNEVLKNKKTLSGEPVESYIDVARDIIIEKLSTKSLDFVHFFTNFGESIPPGTHIAYQFSGGFLHHAIYMGSNLVIEVLNVDVPDSNKRVQGFITLNHIDHFAARVMSNISDFIVHVYTNKYPLEVIKKRAGWSLGKFPNYHIINENCESFASWVLTNQYTPSACVLLKHAQLTMYDPGVDEAINELTVNIRNEANIESVSGGHRRNTRKHNKRLRRKHTHKYTH